MRKLTVMKINEALISRKKQLTKLGIGKNKMFPIRKATVKLTYNRNKTLKVTKELYSALYHS